jgi:hypothetical protein
MIVVVTDAHIDKRRKTQRLNREIRVKTDLPCQEILETCIRLVRAEKTEPWSGIARKMSTKESDYSWFTGNENPLQFPWYDHEAILLKDPQRPSIGPVEEDEPEGSSFGPSTQGPPGPKPPGPPGPPPHQAQARQDGRSGNSRGRPRAIQGPTL